MLRFGQLLCFLYWHTITESLLYGPPNTTWLDFSPYGLYECGMKRKTELLPLPNLHPFPFWLLRKYKRPQEKSKVRVNIQLVLLPPSSRSLLVLFPLDCNDQRLGLGEGGHEEGNSHRTHHVWCQQSWKTGVLLTRSLPWLYKWQHLGALEMCATHTLFLQVTTLGHKSGKLEFSEVPKCPGVTTVLQTVCRSAEEDAVLDPAWHQPV